MENAKDRMYVTEPRAVSFENYLRNAFSISPYRNQYTLNGILIIEVILLLQKQIL